MLAQLPLWVTHGLIPLAVITLLLWVYRAWTAGASGSGGGSGSSAGGGRRAAAIQRDTVLLLGPVNAGKTTLLYQLTTGKTVETVTSIKPGAIRGRLWRQRSEASAPLVKLVDLPGHPQLRAAVLEAAPTAAAIVLVLDATALGGEGAHLKAAADLLYDLFSLPGLVECAPCPPPLLVALNKADAPGAREPEAVQRLLEAEL